MTRNDATPGPWTCTPTEDGAYALNPSGVGWLRCSKDETWANARLIAAAPELLDALRAFCGDYESTPTTSDTSLKAAYLHALTVIARGEGR